MLVMSTQLNLAVFGVFLTLGVTEIVLAIGQFNAGSAVLPTGTIKVGGYIGLVTAARRLVHLDGRSPRAAWAAGSGSPWVGRSWLPE